MLITRGYCYFVVITILIYCNYTKYIVSAMKQRHKKKHLKGPDNHVNTFISLSDQRSHGKSRERKQL